MEFKVNSKELEKLLTKIIPAVPSRTPMPILENFLLEVKEGLLTIYATDLEISLKSTLPVVSEDEINIVIPAKLLYDIVRSLHDTTINFKITDNGKVNLSTNKGKYTLSYLSSDEYPEIPAFPSEGEEQKDLNHMILSGLELKYAFDKTAFAMSKEEMRPAMMGLLFELIKEGIRFVATDGHRLVNLLKTNISPTVEAQYIVPERAVSVLTKVLDDKDVNIFFNKTHVSFSLEGIELITRLIGQKYPDYKSVIPMENEFLMKVKTKELNDAIKRMMLFSTSNTRRVKFSVADNSLTISAEDPDMGASAEESVECEFKGDAIDIGFNSTYVHDILSHLTGEEEIIFKLHSPTKAVIIEPSKKKENQDLMMLLMPVRLNN